MLDFCSVYSSMMRLSLNIFHALPPTKNYWVDIGIIQLQCPRHQCHRWHFRVHQQASHCISAIWTIFRIVIYIIQLQVITYRAWITRSNWWAGGFSLFYFCLLMVQNGGIFKRETNENRCRTHTQKKDSVQVLSFHRLKWNNSIIFVHLASSYFPRIPVMDWKNLIRNWTDCLFCVKEKLQ